MQRQAVACVSTAAWIACAGAAAAAPATCAAGPHLLRLAASTSASQLDLLTLGRSMARDRGMAEARDALEAWVVWQDASRGRFERELIRAVQDGSYRVADAIDALPREGSPGSTTRQNVLFVFVNGLGQTRKSRSTRLLVDAVQYLRAEGFGAELLRTSPYASSKSNAREILLQLKGLLGEPSFHHVVVVAASKGVHDFVHSLAASEDHARDALSSAELGRIRYVVSLSGVVRGSVVAGWLVDSRGLLPRIVRSVMRAPLIGRFPHLEGVRSLGRDPWDELRASGTREGLAFVWVSFVVFPDGANGHPRTGPVRARILRSLQGSASIGPYDGLAESAAAVLPPGTGLEQWVVRVRGAHGMVDGRYVDGTPVATDAGRAARQIVDSLLRTLPMPGQAVATLSKDPPCRLEDGLQARAWPPCNQGCRPPRRGSSCPLTP